MTSRQHPFLLLIHGFPLDRTMWDDQVAGLQDIAEPIVPDLRGFGDDHGELPNAMPMETYAADLKQLLDARGVERVVLCGLSMGGYIAMAFMDQWPERVQGLILCNTRANADTAEGRVARETTAQDASEKGMSVIARAMVPKVLSRSTLEQRPEVAVRVERMMARQRPEAVAAASRGMALRADRMDLLTEVRVPTLIITGSDDQLMPLPTSQAMADAIPGSRLEVIQGAGHLSPLEKPEAFNRVVRDLLSDLSSTK